MMLKMKIFVKITKSKNEEKVEKENELKTLKNYFHYSPT